MREEYRPDELLPLSGIQHFAFCRRQWALIHVERQWEDNALTAEGKLLHQRTDDPFLTETRGGIVVARAMPVASYRLGLYGICDVVELALPEDLRERVSQMAAEMHAYFSRGHTPKVRVSRACKSCSLADRCLPTLQAKKPVYPDAC
jgi:hypothetical protein